MQKLNSIYPEVAHILNTFPGLISNRPEAFERSVDFILIKKFTRKQFNQYQEMNKYLWFLTQEEFESITKSKSLLKKWVALRQTALDWYMEYNEEAIERIAEETLQEALDNKLSKEKTVEIGYDLSDIPSSELEKLFEKYGIPDRAFRDEERLCYVFNSYFLKKTKIEVRMGAHPFANGLLFDTKQGTRGEGYCSYIGIKGPESFVNEFKELMARCGYCKDYSDTPDFI